MNALTLASVRISSQAKLMIFWMAAGPPWTPNPRTLGCKMPIDVANCIIRAARLVRMRWLNPQTKSDWLRQSLEASHRVNPPAPSMQPASSMV